MKFRLFIFALSFCLFLSVSSAAQDATVREMKTFDSDGLKFKYPADWTLTDKSNAETQHLMLSKNNHSVLIVIASPRATEDYVQRFRKFQNDIHADFGSVISQSLSTSRKHAENELVCMDFNGANIPGTKYTGAYNGEPGEGETYTFILGKRSLTTVYLKTEKDSMAGDWVWQEVLKSLTLNGSSSALPGVIFNARDSGVVNGKAVKLVKPLYPISLRPGEIPRAGGTVKVKVVIDEEGKVISAMPHSGVTAFMKASIGAAKKSVFQPTLVCGKPIKVVGLIEYNYIGNN